MPLAVELVSPERIALLGRGQHGCGRAPSAGATSPSSPATPRSSGALATWTVEISLADGSHELAAVHGGFVEVSNDHVKILSDLAEMASSIDADRARRAQEKAQAAVARGEDVEAEAALNRANARLAATGTMVH